MAAKTLPRLLAWAELQRLPRASSDLAGIATPHSPHVAGQSDLGPFLFQSAGFKRHVRFLTSRLGPLRLFAFLLKLGV